MTSNSVSLPNGTLTGYAWIALAATLWATLGTIARLVLRDGMEPLEISFWRAALAGAMFAAHALARGWKGVRTRDLPGVAVFAAVGVAGLYTAYFQAVNTGGVALAAILLYTAPAWVAIAAALWLGERLTRRSMLAIGVTLLGIALVAVRGQGTVRLTPAAIAWGLVSGIAYAVYYLFGKRWFARYEAQTIFAVALPLGALFLLPFVTFAEKSAMNWLVLVVIALVPTYLAYLAYAAGMRRVQATRAATVATLEPVVAATLAFIVWGEALGALGYAGAAVVLAGVLVMTSAPDAPPPAHEGPAPDV